MSRVELHLGDCLEVLPTLPDASVDCVITDPPYPEISRDYGRLTEAEWWTLIVEGVVPQVQRILKPTGSTVFILQPNSRKVGSMRGWLWEFMAWVCREWNMVQDAWWWNITAVPSGGSTTCGLLRSSVKACVWAGNDNCFRNQSAVLWSESEGNIAKRASARSERKYKPSGHSMNEVVMSEAALKRGGVTPFNLLPIKNGGTECTGAVSGHSAGTPVAVADWWTRYICPPGGIVLDPFLGSGTMGLAALQNGCGIIGIEKMPRYFEIAEKRISAAQSQLSLF